MAADAGSASGGPLSCTTMCDLAGVGRQAQADGGARADVLECVGQGLLHDAEGGSQAAALLACDFIEIITLKGQCRYIGAVIEHATRRIRVVGTTAHPTANWVVQAIRNLVVDLDDAGCRAHFLLRDRDGKFPALIDEILADAGIKTVLTGIRIPRMNSIMERWVQSCRRELLDRCLVWNEHHLRHAQCRARCVDGELDEGLLATAKQLTDIGRKVKEGAPKTDSSDAVVALDKGTIAALRAHKTRQNE